MLPKENIVAQYQAAIAVTDKFFTDQECLGEAFRFGLHGVFNFYAIIRAIAQQVFKTELVFGRGDNQGFPYPCQHQHR